MTTIRLITRRNAMKEGEAQRRLGRVGWIKIRNTAGGHEIWRSPNGKLKTLSLGHVERNQAALVRQAERAATSMKEDRLMEVRVPETMTSATALTSTPKSTPKVSEKPREWDFKVYRTPDSVKSRFVELAFGEAALEHLGGPGVRVSVELDADGFWMLRSGGPLLVKAEGISRYRVKTTAMTDALPHTGRTPIRVERRADGFRLFPDGVTVTKPRHKARGISGAVEAHQASIAAEPPSTAPGLASSSGGALEAEQSASASASASTTAPQAELLSNILAGAFAAAPPPPKKAASLDDLRAAMKLLREVVDDLGVTLYGANGLSVQLDDIEVRVKL
jgi:hypothetical protein